MQLYCDDLKRSIELLERELTTVEAKHEKQMAALR